MGFMSTENDNNDEKADNSGVVKLVHHLQNVETEGATAEANKTTMRDGQGRILKFNEDGGVPKNGQEERKRKGSRVFTGVEELNNTIKGVEGWT